MSLQNKIFEGFLEIGDFAAAVDRCPPTIDRWTRQANGLPYTKVGNRRLIHIESARAWMLSRMRQKNPRRNQQETIAY
jgi:hypothetical protein